MKSRKVKWYSPRLMLRAGQPSSVFRCGLAGIHAQEDGSLQLVAYADSFGITRDGQAVTKEFARATADIPAKRLFLCAGITRDGASMLVQQMQSHMDAAYWSVRSVSLDKMSGQELADWSARHV